MRQNEINDRQQTERPPAPGPMNPHLKPQWELVHKHGDHQLTDRLSVPGGWLYRVIVAATSTPPALCYVPVEDVVAAEDGSIKATTLTEAMTPAREGAFRDVIVSPEPPVLVPGFKPSLPHHYAMSHEPTPQRLWNEQDMRDYAAVRVEKEVAHLKAAHDARVIELLEANNYEVERRRAAEK